MAWSRKKKIVGGFFGLLIATFLLVTATPSKEANLRMAFVRTTNTPFGLWCVFRVENEMNGAMTTRGGFYQPTNVTNIVPQPGHLPAICPRGPVSIPARSTNLLEIVMPTNMGSYTLILPWRPAKSRSPWQLVDPVSRVKIWYSRQRKAPPEELYQSLGGVYAASDMFEVSSSPP